MTANQAVSLTSAERHSGVTWLRAGGALPVAAIALLVTTALLAATAIARGSRSAAAAAIITFALSFAVTALASRTVLLLMVVALTPLVTIELGFGNTGATLSADKLVLAVVTLIFWLDQRLRGALKPEAALVARWLVALCIVIAVDAGLRGVSLSEIFVLARQFTALSIFLMAFHILKDRNRRDELLRWVIRGAGAVSVLTVLQWALYAGGGWMVPLFFKSGTVLDQLMWGSMPSTIGHANFLGGYLAVTAPVALVALAGRRFERRGLLVGIVASEVAAIAISKSIGTAAGLAIGLVAALILAWPLLDRRARIMLVGAATAAGILATVYLADSPRSLYDRLEIYRVGLRMVLDHPLLGLGAGGFSDRYPAYHQAVFGRAPDYGPSAAHNSFLEILASWGIPGLICVLGALATLVVGTSARLRHHIAHGRIPIALGIWLGLIAFSFNALSENLFSSARLNAVFWVLAAALLRELEDASVRSSDAE